MSDISDTIQRIINDAKKLEGEEKYEEAYTVLSDAIKRVESNSPSLASLLNQRGIVLRGQGRYDAAFEDYVKALDLPSATNDEKAHSYINIADIYRVRDSDFLRACQAIKDAREIATEGGFMQAKAADQKGMILYAQTFAKDINEDLKKHLLNAARLEYSKSIEITERLIKNEPHNTDAKKLYANSTHRLGIVKFLLDPKLANEACLDQTRAFKVHAEIDNYQGISNTVSALGMITRASGNIPHAIKQYNVALRCTKNKRGITGLSLALAEAYTSLGNFREAEPHVKTFLEGVTELPLHDLPLIKNSFQNLFGAYQKSGQNIDNLKKVYETFKDI